MLEETAKVDKVLCKFKTHSITKTNELFYAGAVVVTNKFVVKINKASERKEPRWRRRLQNKIKELRKDLSQLESSKKEYWLDKDIKITIKTLVSNVRHRQTLERKYSIRLKALSVAIEELKQRIVAIAAKIRRYQERVDLDKAECNWKSPGPDLIQWLTGLKDFSSLHGRVRSQLKECLGSGFVRNW